MAAVNFRNATSIQGNPVTTQSFALPTVLPGDVIILTVGKITGGAGISITGAGTWTHQNTDSTIAGQIFLATYIAISKDGSESGATVNIVDTIQAKVAAVAASYSGVWLANPLGSSSPLYAQNTTSNTTSATSPTVSPVPGQLVVEYFTSKSSTNTSYTTPGGLTSRQQVFGTGGAAVDLAFFDSNGIVTSGGGHTTTESIATANKIAGTIVLNVAPSPYRIIRQAVNRSAVW